MTTLILVQGILEYPRKMQSQVAVPPGSWFAVVKLLHEVHPSIVWLKELVCSYMWRPERDQWIESVV